MRLLNINLRKKKKTKNKVNLIICQLQLVIFSVPFSTNFCFINFIALNFFLFAKNLKGK